MSETPFVKTVLDSARVFYTSFNTLGYKKIDLLLQTKVDSFKPNGLIQGCSIPVCGTLKKYQLPSVYLLLGFIFCHWSIMVKLIPLNQFKNWDLKSHRLTVRQFERLCIRHFSSTGCNFDMHECSS